MLAKSLLVLLVAAVGLSAASGVAPKSHDKKDIPHHANFYFKDDVNKKEAEYLYFGGGIHNHPVDNKTFCKRWNNAAQELKQPGGVNVIFSGCLIVDAEHQVAAVWATEAQNRGHTFSQTGRVGYNHIIHMDFVRPQEAGVGCHKIVGKWCKKLGLSHTGVDLTVQNQTSHQKH